MDKGKLGRDKESLAVSFLKKKGYKIIERNYTCPIGEIDIIATMKNVLVFAEVKYRSSEYFGMPREAVNIYKQRKIRSVATYYLKWHGKLNENCRFDVIEILGDKIEHIENCF